MFSKLGLLTEQYSITWELIRNANSPAIPQVCGCCSVAQLCRTLCDPMDYSMPGFRLSSSPGVCSNSCPWSQWYYPTLTSSVAPFSSCSQSFPASGSFPVSWLFVTGGWSFGASALVSVLPMNSQGWFPLGLTGLICLLSKGLQHHSSKALILWCSAFFMVQRSHLYMTTGKTIALTIGTFVSKVMSLH